MSSEVPDDSHVSTPLCGVYPVPHGSTVVQDPVGTRSWSEPSHLSAQTDQHSHVPVEEACRVGAAPSSHFSFATPMASTTLFSTSTQGSYVPPVRAVNFAPLPVQHGSSWRV